MCLSMYLKSFSWIQRLKMSQTISLAGRSRSSVRTAICATLPSALVARTMSWRIAGLWAHGWSMALN